jgi:hypothetical protein
MVWRVAAFALIALIAACGVAEDPVLPTPRPTFTPSLEPSATDTRVFNASPTPTALQVALVTSGPTPTALIGDVPTRSMFTITPTLVNYVPGTLQIEYFTTNSTSVRPGDKLTLYWSTKGVDRAVIYRLDSSGKRGQVWNVNKSGSLDVQTQTDDRDAAQFLLSIGDDKTHLDQTLTVPVQCTNVWFFDPQPSGCPAVTPIVSTEVQQTFERGQMIWVQQQLRIYVLFNDGQQPAWATYPDEFKDGQPDRDPSIQPPSGFFQPIRGFGLVWRTRERVRARLGWATQAEVPTQGAYQGDATVDNGAMYIRAKDGNILALFNKGASWKLITP